MTLEELKAFLNSEEGKGEEIQAYLQGLYPLTVEGVQKFINENKDARSFFDSEKDKHSTKSLETWKTNNLTKLINEAVAKANPQETPEQKQIRELTERLNKKEADEKRQVIKNFALTHANSKKLPVEILDYFLGDSEDTTTANLTKLEEIFNKHITEAVEQRIKGGGNYVPPGNETPPGDDVSKMKMEEYIKYREKQGI